MKRKMTQEDLRDKGVPFVCNNCGARPTADDVVRLDGNCDVCGDEILAYTIEAAQMIIKLKAEVEGKAGA